MPARFLLELASHLGEPNPGPLTFDLHGSVSWDLALLATCLLAIWLCRRRR